jgi:hypothetical protein
MAQQGLVADYHCSGMIVHSGDFSRDTKDKGQT